MPDNDGDKALQELLLPTADGIPRTGDVTTLRSFVRLMRWQHGARRQLLQRLAAAGVAADCQQLQTWSGCVVMVAANLEQLEVLARRTEKHMTHVFKAESPLGSDGLNEHTRLGPDGATDWDLAEPTEDLDEEAAGKLIEQLLPQLFEEAECGSAEVLHLFQQQEQEAAVAAAGQLLGYDTVVRQGSDLSAATWLQSRQWLPGRQSSTSSSAWSAAAAAIQDVQGLHEAVRVRLVDWLTICGCS
eukprot:gene5736-5976_t